MARIVHHTTVVRDGHHNAFTDLQCWQGCYWVGYRKGAGHVSMDGAAAVAVSADGKRFREAAELHVPGDNRDPKLLPVDDERMALYFPSWVRGAPDRTLQHFISFSGNGFSWSEPQPILPRQKWLWRVRPHDGVHYGLVVDLSGSWENGNKPHELELWTSRDLLEWAHHATVGAGLGLNESDIHFCADGEAWIVARTVKQDEATGSYFAAAPPPYTEWATTPMRPMVHAPVCLEHEGALYVAGRNQPAREGDQAFPHASPSMALWRLERGALERLLQFPAAGDCSYPGMVRDAEGRVCMSYYSQHAYLTGVLPQPSGLGGHNREAASDVYFAQLEL